MLQARRRPTVELAEIAGNDDILSPCSCPSAPRPPAGAVALIEVPLADRPGWRRVGVSVKVERLLPLLRATARGGRRGRACLRLLGHGAGPALRARLPLGWRSWSPCPLSARSGRQVAVVGDIGPRRPRRSQRRAAQVVEVARGAVLARADPVRALPRRRLAGGRGPDRRRCFRGEGWGEGFRTSRLISTVQPLTLPSPSRARVRRGGKAGA